MVTDTLGIISYLQDIVLDIADIMAGISGTGLVIAKIIQISGTTSDTKAVIIGTTNNILLL